MSSTTTSQKHVWVSTAVSLAVVTLGTLWYWKQDYNSAPEDEKKERQEPKEQDDRQPTHTQTKMQTRKQKRQPKVVRRKKRKEKLNLEEEEKKEEYTLHNDDTDFQKLPPPTFEPPMLEIQTRSITTIAEDEKEDFSNSQHRRILAPNTITVAHGSVTGTCAKLASDLVECLREKHLDHDRTIQMGNLEEWDWWDELLNYEKRNPKRRNRTHPFFSCSYRPTTVVRGHQPLPAWNRRSKI
jgi:hypothetical protein